MKLFLLPQCAQRICSPLQCLQIRHRFIYSNTGDLSNNKLKDTTHNAHHLFHLLPSGRCIRSITSRTNRLRNSFYTRSPTLIFINFYHKSVQNTLNVQYLNISSTYLLLLLFFTVEILLFTCAIC